MRDIIKSAAIHQRSWIWLLINLLIPTVGVLFLNWNLFGLLYIFWAEWILLGIFGLLRMFFSNGDTIITRIAISAFFAILYAALLMIVISFSLVKMNFAEFLNFDNSTRFDNAGLNWSLAVLILNFTIEFFSDFLLNGKYKTHHALAEVFKTFAYTLPLACVILFAIIPLSEKMAGAQVNTFIILGVVLVKAFLDFVIKRGSRYFEKQLESAGNISI